MGLMLCGLRSVLQAAKRDGLSCDPFTFEKDGQAAPAADADQPILQPQKDV